MEFEDEGYSELKLAHKDKIRVIKQLAWEAEQDMPIPVTSGWSNAEDRKERLRILHEGALDAMDIWNKIKSEKNYFDEPGFDVPLLDWTPNQIKEMVKGRSRADQITAEIRQILENPRPTPRVSFRPEVPVPTQNGLSNVRIPEEAPAPTALAEVPVTPVSPAHTPPGEPPLSLNKDTSLSLRSLNSESEKSSATLRRTQSCAGTARQFIPPMAASSPRPMRGDLNRSTSTDSAQYLQRQNSFKKSIPAVRSSGYGQPATLKVRFLVLL